MRAFAVFGVSLAVFLAAVVAGPGMLGQRGAAADEVQGDADCSGVVDEHDMLAILASFAGVGDASCVGVAGDVDCDLTSGPFDGLWIARFAAGAPAQTPEGCAPIGEPVQPASSFDRIDTALAHGLIDQQTAVLYGVYATFLDDRLPDAYRGDDSNGPPDDHALNDAAYLFDTFSPGTQALLAPFLVPPIYEGSWLNTQSSSAQPAAVPPAVCPGSWPGWRCVDAAGADVRVWWQTQHAEDEARAQSIADEMNSTIWPELTALMGQPLSDAGLASDGGSGAVDIYMVDAARSATPAHPAVGCKKTPAYIDLARGESFDVVAHEFMHVLQWSFDVSSGCMYQPGGDYNWLAEATATWAQSWVYPGSQAEHYIADWYMKAPGEPLETRNDRHEYGAYLFFLGLTEEALGGQVIRDIWDDTTQYGSLESVDRALPGGFEERWPVFASCLWNAAPVDCYAQWDELAKSAAAFVKPTEVGLEGQTSHSITLDGAVEHMGVAYYSYEFTDSDMESVVFRNTLMGYPHASVQALAKIDGQWRGPIGWTGQGTASFCTAYEGQNIEELVLIVANSDWELKGKLAPPEPLTLTLSSVGCTDWIGTARADLYNGIVPTIKYNIEVTDLRFAYYETVGNEARYALVGSSPATWYASGTNGPCTVSSEMPLGPAQRFSVGDILGRLTLNTDDRTYRIEITGLDPEVKITTTCPDTDPIVDTWPYVSITDDGNLDYAPTADGRLDDEYTTTLGLVSGTWSWHLDPAPPEEQ